MAKQKIHITEEQAGQRLDVVLSEQLNLSRSQAQKMIELGQILVNDKPPKKAGDVMKEGYKIVVRAQPSVILNEVRNLNHLDHSAAPQNNNDKKNLTPEVIAETPDYLVINKPSGLLVHPTQAGEKNTLADWLKKKYPKVKKVGDDPAMRPGIVHRLDKEASGLIVVALTQKMFDYLKKQFKNRTVEKEYLALAHGKVAKDWDEITFPIARGENSDRMAARPLAKPKYVSTLAVKKEIDTEADEEMAPGEKEAHTEFFTEKRFVNFALLRVIIHTGRMHQIRAHLLAYNHPIVGDPLYFQKKRKRTWDEKCGRLFLHSTKLGFIDLKGEKQIFESPLPAQLASFLNKLA